MSLLSSDADDCSDTATEGVQESGDIHNNEGLLDLSIEYLLTKSYPKNSDIKLKRSIRRRASLLISEDGQIFIRKKNRRVKVITTSIDRMKILKACHSDPTSGHFGVTKTRKKISERFYWKGMMQQIKEMVEFCEVCQHMNSKPTVERPQLYPIPVKSPMHHVGIDFVGPISPTTVNGEWKKNFLRKRKRGGSLEYRWEVPFIISKSLGRGLYRLQERNGGKIIQRINGAHLKIA